MSGSWWSSAPVWGTYENGTFPDVGGRTELFVSLVFGEMYLSRGYEVFFVFIEKAGHLHNVQDITLTVISLFFSHK